MKFVQNLAVALLSTFALGTACATPISEDLVASFADTQKIDIGSTAYSFNISFLGGSNPFVPEFDSITNGTLSIKLDNNSSIKDSSKGGKDPKPEVPNNYSVTFLGKTFTGTVPNNSPLYYNFILDADMLASLWTAGTTDVSILATSGSFRYWEADMTIGVTRGEVVQPPVAEVPEPLSIALMGLGLAGLTAARRRK